MTRRHPDISPWRSSRFATITLRQMLVIVVVIVVRESSDLSVHGFSSHDIINGHALRAIGTHGSFSSMRKARPPLWDDRGSTRHGYRGMTGSRKSAVLTSTASDENRESGDDDGVKKKKKKKKKKNVFRRAKEKFKARPYTYLAIPVIAALVGWFTNYLAVQMIFYPVNFVGIPIYRRPEIPLGLLGWQGIVPCKTRPMSESMVEMVTTQLLCVEEVFAKLDPRKMAELLAPEVPKIVESIVADIAPSPVTKVPRWLFSGLTRETKGVVEYFNMRFLTNFASDMQRNIQSVLSIENCVVEKMMQDRTLLGDLFKKCGEKELEFLTNSGLWFGFMLGLIQMAVALVWDNPWSLSIGGGIVGLATNWLALKWIFEPVNPTKVGPFVLQGQFLRRQTEVAKEFSAFFAEKVLNSESVWNSILTDPQTSPKFRNMFGGHLNKFIVLISGGVLGVKLEDETVAMMTRRAIEKLPNHIHVLHNYVDETLGLKEVLRVSMEKMSSLQFERVLHPIFEEDELTLILAGAVLGFAAGLVQQGLETGVIQIKIPTWKELREWPGRMVCAVKTSPNRIKCRLVKSNESARNRARSVKRRVSSLFRPRDKCEKENDPESVEDISSTA